MLLASYLVILFLPCYIVCPYAGVRQSLHGTLAPAGHQRLSDALVLATNHTFKVCINQFMCYVFALIATQASSS